MRRTGLLVGILLAAAAAQAASRYPTIRAIVVEPQPIFGDEERIEPGSLLEPLNFVFDTANFIHVDTRARVISRELLVREGGPADPELLAESERNLRDLEIVREVRIFTRPVAPGVVDVVVETQDTWTTEPRASFSSGGGTEKVEFGLIEKNLLGFGKTLGVRYLGEIDRDSTQVFYSDPRLFGSRWRFDGNAEDTSDGRILQALVEYPFFSLETPWSGGMSYSSVRERGRVFASGAEELAEFSRDGETLQTQLGHRLPWSDDETVERAGLFYDMIEEDFGLVEGDPTFVPRNRRYSAPGLFYQRQEVRFVKELHFNRFDRVEDFNLGNIFNARIGASTTALGARTSEPLVTISDQQGFDFGPGRKGFLFAFLTGRYRDGALRNGIAELEAIYYDRFEIGLDQTFVARAKIDLGKNLDRDVQLFLGNDNGLRGFSTRQLVGNKRFVFNLEDRLFFVNDFLRLVSLGGVIFFDAGHAWGPGTGVRPGDVAMSVGIGLRIGAPRSSGEKLWRFDLAFPLTRGAGESFGPGFSFGSGQAFRPFTGPFELQTTGGD